jgi:hypothetical protein
VSKSELNTYRTMDCKKCYSKHGPILEEIDNFDWREAHHYAKWDREDVKEIINMEDGCNDEESWIGIFRLNNGKIGLLRAWCDYTGWD